MKAFHLNLLLADDDQDDCQFFKDALTELPFDSNITIVNDGIQLMRHLESHKMLPDALFLDLNMPRKNGFECLTEIRANKNFNPLPIIIYSTSFDSSIVDLLFEKGAQIYVRKPGDYSKLKQVISEALATITKEKNAKPSKDKLVIQAK